MPLLPKFLLAFGLFLSSVVVSAGTAVADDDLFAVRQFATRECENQNGAACAYLGSLYVLGGVVAQDYTKALEYFTKGCEWRDGNACGALGLLGTAIN